MLDIRCSAWLRQRFWVAIALSAGVVIAAGPAEADPADEIGLTPRAAARAGAQAAAADDFSAAYYNPARLSGQPAAFSLGYAGGEPRAFVDRTSPGRLGSAVFPAEFDGTTVGLVAPLGGLLKRRVTFGLAAYFPRAAESEIRLYDQSRPQWVRWDEDAGRLVLAPALAVRVWRGLSLGLGGDILSRFIGDAELTVEQSFQDQSQNTVDGRNYSNDLHVTFSPIFGAAWVSGPLELGAYYHHTMELPFHLPIVAWVPSVSKTDPLAIDAQGVADYSPPRFGLGGSYDFGWHRLKLDGEFDYQLWHLAPPQQYDVTVRSPGLMAEILGKSISGTDINPGFRDTWVARLAAELPVGERGRVILGGRYRPTPLTAQSGETNYLDNDTLAVSLGGGYRFDDPLRIAAGGVRLEAALTGAWLFWQDAHKADATEASYRYGGWEWNAIVSLTWVLDAPAKA